MKELGMLSHSLHADLADPVRNAGVDLAILVGEEMAPLAEALDGTLWVEQVKDVADAIEQIAGRLKDGDVVLVKGSNSVGLSKLVSVLGAETV
jgi:UDP-N-acetylmuramoyl-tripeptide--D-alanyl-D-alanine ligase